MTLVCRIGRLFKADLHGILDTLEEPELVLKQAIREMEEEVVRGEQVVKELVRKQEKMEGSRAECARTLGEIAAQIELCFQSKKEELARSCIRRKLELERHRKHLERVLESVSVQKVHIESGLAEKREKLVKIMEKVEVLRADPNLAQGRKDRDGISEPACVSVSDEDVELAYLAEKLRRESSPPAELSQERRA